METRTTVRPHRFADLTLKNVDVKFIKDNEDTADVDEGQDLVYGCQPYKISAGQRRAETGGRIHRPVLGPRHGAPAG